MWLSVQGLLAKMVPCSLQQWSWCSQLGSSTTRRQSRCHTTAPEPTAAEGSPVWTQSGSASTQARASPCEGSFWEALLPAQSDIACCPILLSKETQQQLLIRSRRLSVLSEHHTRKQSPDHSDTQRGPQNHSDQDKFKLDPSPPTVFCKSHLQLSPSNTPQVCEGEQQ